jgi:hypothetical protein
MELTCDAAEGIFWYGVVGTFGGGAFYPAYPVKFERIGGSIFGMNGIYSVEDGVIIAGTGLTADVLGSAIWFGSAVWIILF